MSVKKQDFIDLKDVKFGTGLHLLFFCLKHLDISEAKLVNRSIITQINKMLITSVVSTEFLRRVV